MNFVFVAQADAQTVISFTDFPESTEIREKYVSKGVLFSSRFGTPTIVRDGLVTGKAGLCALGRRSIMGISTSACEDVYIGFVSPEEKMIHNFAHNIEITLLAVGAVSAAWINSEGYVQRVQAHSNAFGELVVSVPGETEGVLLFSTAENCTICNFTVTRLSFALGQSVDQICDKPTIDAAFSWQRLVNEDYSPEVYNRLDEFRKPGQSLKIQFQHLRLGQQTFYDEFAIIVKLPNSEQDLAREIFTDMRRKLDTVGLGAAAQAFTDIGTFRYFEPKRIAARPDKLPIVGDIFQVDINPGFHVFGIDNGDVMMTELVGDNSESANAFFRYSTLNNDLGGGSGSHPNNGSREYGYYGTLDGWTKFYVRGIDQFKINQFKYTERLSKKGVKDQREFWLSFLEGIGNRVKFYNGEVIYPAKKTFDGNLNNPPACHVPPKKGYRYEGY